MKNLKFIPALLLAVAFTFTACEKDNEVSPSSNETEESGFTARMTDSPADYDALTVQVLRVEAYNDQEGWITINNETNYVSVLELTNGTETTIASDTDIEAGAYTKLKVVFGNDNHLTINANAAADAGINSSTANVQANADGSFTLDLEWEGPQSIEVEIDEEVSSESSANVLIDFNVAQSIRQDAQTYIISPFMTEIKNETTGVKGQVEGQLSAAILATNGQDTVSTYTDANGQFLIRGLNGNEDYDIIIMPTTDGVAENAEEHTIESVLITEGEIKTLNTINIL